MNESKTVVQSKKAVPQEKWGGGGEKKKESGPSARDHDLEWLGSLGPLLKVRLECLGRSGN